MPYTDALKHLVAVDRDAVGAYTQAIEAIRDAEIGAMLAEFRIDHERHITDLTRVLTEIGESVPEAPHPEGFALAGFTRIAASTTVTHGLMAMESNEIVTNRAYEKALEHQDMPAATRELVERNRNDERRHLEAMREMMRRHTRFAAGANAVATMQGHAASGWLNSIRGNVPAMIAIGAAAGLLVGGAAWMASRNGRGKSGHGARSQGGRSHAQRSHEGQAPAGE
jgi:uncharacterized protein (TIGR02284 family)